MIDTFGKAYTCDFPLTMDELQAIPAALRLRDMASLMYRIRRYHSGLVTDTAMQKRVQHTLWREAWLSAHEGTLLRYTSTWI